jgi:hypothetical protein
VANGTPSCAWRGPQRSRPKHVARERERERERGKRTVRFKRTTPFEKLPRPSAYAPNLSLSFYLEAHPPWVFRKNLLAEPYGQAPARRPANAPEAYRRGVMET